MTEPNPRYPLPGDPADIHTHRPQSRQHILRNRANIGNTITIQERIMARTTLKFLNWNIMKGGGPRIDRIVERIQHHNPDIVVLTEFQNNKRGELLQTELAGTGWNRRNGIEYNHYRAGHYGYHRAGASATGARKYSRGND